MSHDFADFLADFGCRGEVLGLGLGSRPEEWAAKLGDEFRDGSRRSDHLERDFGLLAASFRVAEPGGWVCDYVKIRVAELRSPDDVPTGLRDRLGDFPERIAFDAVADRAASAGGSVQRLTRIHPAALEQYWFPGGEVMFWVISPAQLADFPCLRVGDVYSATRSNRATIRPEHGTRYR